MTTVHYITPDGVKRRAWCDAEARCAWVFLVAMHCRLIPAWCEWRPGRGCPLVGDDGFG